jgi:hypothetical protein
MGLKAQVVLTPTEAKRLLSKAVLNLPEVKKALKEGIVILHPSSTTIFMLQELGYSLTPERIWVCGHISPKGLCMARPIIDTVMETPNFTSEMYPFDLVLKKGELLPFKQPTLGPILEEMGPQDIYVKGVNVVDPEGNAGVLLAEKKGGSLGLVLRQQKTKKFKIIIPVGIEKRLGISLTKAIEAARDVEKAQGIPCGLWHLRGKLLTEIEAFRLLFDVEAIPVSAGGLCGAEGAVTWVLQGEEKNVQEAFDLCYQIRGHQLPFTLPVYECAECPNPICQQSGKSSVDKRKQFGR